MGAAQKRDSDDDYRKRDEGILRLLRSPDDAEQKIGMADLGECLRGPFAITMKQIALKSSSEAFEAVLTENLQLDQSKLEDIWHETQFCLLKNIEKKEKEREAGKGEGFEVKDNLLAYLVRIAIRRLAAEWREGRRLYYPAEMEGIEGASPDVPSDLIDKIEEFYHTLNDDDRKIAKVCVRLARRDPSNAKKSKVIIEKIRKSGILNGNDKAIIRRYYRIRKRLRKYLQERGYYV